MMRFFYLTIVNFYLTLVVTAIYFINTAPTYKPLAGSLESWFLILAGVGDSQIVHHVATKQNNQSVDHYE